jgi:site-specific recombinase XerD
MDDACNRFIETISGRERQRYSPLTINSYRQCLITNPHSLCAFTKLRGPHHVEQVMQDDLHAFREYLKPKVDPRTVMRFVTATRQLFTFAHENGWTERNVAASLRSPKPREQQVIEVVKPEVCELLLSGDWGCNDFTRRRNHLILCLFANRGLHPMEIPPIELAHVEPYRDLAVITVCGKRRRWREVMLDPVTWKALQDYAPARGKYLHWRHSDDSHLVLASEPRLDGSYMMTTGGVSAVVHRVARELRRKGCLHDLRSLKPNILRHTAESSDWDRVEHLPVVHPELSVSNQYGNSPATALKHYVRRSRRNAYILIKGGSLVDSLRRGEIGSEELKDGIARTFPDLQPPAWTSYDI